MRLQAEAILTGLGLLLGCHRTPEELASAVSSASVTAASTAPAEALSASKATVPGCPPDPEPNLPPLPRATLTISGFDTRPVTIDAEVAWGEHDTQRGLMYRTSMPERHGMIFELERSDHAFWMHNTCISLDLVYIDHGVIVGVVESAPILNDAPLGVGKLSDEVLELNSGFSKRHGVKVGQHVTRAAQSG